MTPLAVFSSRWQKGCGSSECGKAHKIVLGKGTIPCDILFVGEAPGESENVLGLPFVGPAGKLLDRMISDAMSSYTLRLAFTNVVCCIPREADGGKAAEPDVPQIRKCTPRLKEFIELCAPRLVVSVGKMAKDWLAQGYKTSIPIPKGTRQTDITHPAALLRAPHVARQMMYKKNVVTLRMAVAELHEPAPPSEPVEEISYRVADDDDIPF